MQDDYKEKSSAHATYHKMFKCEGLSCISKVSDLHRDPPAKMNEDERTIGRLSSQMNQMRNEYCSEKLGTKRAERGKEEIEKKGTSKMEFSS